MRYKKSHPIFGRFRGFLPVVIDLETGGVDAEKHPILEMAAVFLTMSENGILLPEAEFCEHVTPFEGSEIDKEALEINRIDPGHPLRFALTERDALEKLFKATRTHLEKSDCKLAFLAGHNAHFDLGFLQKAIKRCDLQEESPFHRFSVLDTVSLSALAYGQTILSIACEKSGLGFNAEEAHSALYDAHKTAELICHICNRWLYLGGWNEKTGITAPRPPQKDKKNPNPARKT